MTTSKQSPLKPRKDKKLINQRTDKELPNHPPDKPSRFRKYYKVAVLGALITILVFAASYFFKLRTAKTYYIAYLGRSNAEMGFVNLHHFALTKYLEELNDDLSGVRLELKEFTLQRGDIRSPDFFPNSDVFYQTIANDPTYIGVIDNTWGIDLKMAASVINDNKIPVININSDKLDNDYGRNVVFLGHDDNVPKRVTRFSKAILGANEVIFISEKTFGLKDIFIKEFDKPENQITCHPFYVEKSEYDPGEEKILYQELDTTLNEIVKRQPSKVPTIIINTHGFWGPKIIQHLNNFPAKVNMLGGPFIAGSDQKNILTESNTGSSLIILTNPSDALSSKIYNDLEEIKEKIRNEHIEIPVIVNDKLYIKRCLDALNLIRGAFSDYSGKISRSDISRPDFIKFFQEKLAGKEYRSKDNELYKFDEDLLVWDEKAFETYIKGKVFSYPRQLDSDGNVRLNLKVGLQKIRVQKIDVENKTFRADFVYWFKYPKDYPEVENYISFRNETSQNSKDQLTESRTDEWETYKSYKKLADFSVDVDFKKYPFDSQELEIELESTDLPERINVSLDQKILNMDAAELDIDEWYMNSKDVKVSVENSIETQVQGYSSIEDGRLKKFKTLNVQMPIQRTAGRAFKIILPLVIIGFAAIALLFIEDDSFRHIGGACVVILLSLATYSIAFAQNTPKSNAVTIADLMFSVTFLTVLLVFLKVILFNSNMISKKNKEKAQLHATKIGSAFAVVYSLIMLVVMLFGYTI